MTRPRALVPVCAALILLSWKLLPAQTYTWTTLAGSSGYGEADGFASSARFFNPTGVAMDASNNVYVADFGNNTIRKITPSGIVSTLAGLAGVSGTNDGTGSAARFNQASGLAVDKSNNVFVADSTNHTIRKISSSGMVTTLAGTPGVAGTNDGEGGSALFYYPSGLTLDSSNNLFVADTLNYTIRKITPGGVVSTFAGLAGFYGTNDGTGDAARFRRPAGLAVDISNNVFVADYRNFTVRKITPGGVVTTIAGLGGVAGATNGTGSGARFGAPAGVAVDRSNNVYVSDFTNNVILRITAAGVVTTWAGLMTNNGSADGTGSAARFHFPNGVALDSAANLYVADNFNGTIRKISPATLVSTFAGRASGGTNDGTGSAAGFNGPNSVTVDGAGTVYVADETNNTIRKITAAGVVTTLAGKGGSAGSGNGTGSGALFNHPEGLALDSATNVYVADQFNSIIRKITPAGVVSTLAGTAGLTGTNDGTGGAARFTFPSSVAVDASTNVYVADAYNHTIRKITPAGVVSTWAGKGGIEGTNDGTGGAARFNYPYGVAVDNGGNVYVADSLNMTIRKITPQAVVSTLAGSPGVPGSSDYVGLQASFNYPDSVAVDGAGNVFVGDSFNFTIRMVTPSAAVSTIGGQVGNPSFADGTGSAALFTFSYYNLTTLGGAGVAVDSAGNLYVADHDNNIIRKGIPTSPLAPVSLKLSPPSAAQFAFGLSGPLNLKVNVSSSTNLLDWQLAAGYVLEGGTNFFISPIQTQGSQFYRTHVP